VTNTKVKFFVVIDSSNLLLRDNEIRFVSYNIFLNISFIYLLNDYKMLILYFIIFFDTIYIMLYNFQMFRKLHTAYTDLMCNPFYIPGDYITSELVFIKYYIFLTVKMYYHKQIFENIFW